MKGFAGIAMKAFEIVGSVVGSVIQGIEQLAKVGGVAVAGIAGFSVVALNAAADLDSLKRALFSVAGSAAEADRQFAELRQLAKSPALGLEEAIKGSLALQGAGFGSGMAAKALREFGNAIARSGGGKEQLEGVIIALAQIEGRGKVTADNINQIANAFYGIRKAMKEVYGTADSEELMKMGLTSKQFMADMVKHLEGVPRVTGGIRASFDNLADSAKVAMATIGSVIAERVVPVLDTISSFLEYSVESGLLDRLTRGFSNLFAVPGSGGIGSVLSTVAATMQALPGAINIVGQTVWSVMSSIREGIGLFFKELESRINAFIKVLDFTGIARLMKWIFRGTEGGYSRALDKFGEAFDKAKSGMDRLESYDLFGQISSGAKGIQAGFEAAAKKNKNADIKDDDPQEQKQANKIDQIVRNTFETASNTRQQLDLSRYAIGGGDVGKIGMTPIEMRRAKNVNIKVTGADESLNKLFQDFLRQALPMVVQR